MAGFWSSSVFQSFVEIIYLAIEFGSIQGIVMELGEFGGGGGPEGDREFT